MLRSLLKNAGSLGIKVLGPHVNESGVYFEVNKDGEIRFGLGAIKGAGDSAVEAIIQERDANGPFEDIFEFCQAAESTVGQQEDL